MEIFNDISLSKNSSSIFILAFSSGSDVKLWQGASGLLIWGKKVGK